MRDLFSPSVTILKMKQFGCSYSESQALSKIL